MRSLQNRNIFFRTCNFCQQHLAVYQYRLPNVSNRFFTALFLKYDGVKIFLIARSVTSVMFDKQWTRTLICIVRIIFHAKCLLSKGSSLPEFKEVLFLGHWKSCFKFCSYLKLHLIPIFL